MLLNMPLNEICNRKKSNNYFPGWKICLAYAYFFTDSRLDMLISIMLMKKKHVLLDTFGECYCLKYSEDKLSEIYPEFPKIPPIKLSRAEINRHYPDIA